MEGIELRPWEEGFTVPERFNMVSLLLERHLEQGHGKRIAVYTQDEKITYQQLYELTNRAGNALVNLGIEPEQRVILLLPDGPEFVATFLGAMKIGAVPVPINVLATPSDLTYFLNDSRAKVVVVGQEFLPKVAAIGKQCALLRHVVVVGDDPGENLSFRKLIDESASKLDVFPTHKDDASYWLYSSGTTGQPKGVIHLHHDLVFCVETWGYHVARFTPDDICYCVPRLFFSYGLNMALYLPLYYGAAVALSPHRQEPALVLENIRRYRPTLFFSVPTSYGQILREIEDKGIEADLSSVRYCVSAGEALPGPLYDRWLRRFGIEILDGLGSTEVGWVYISNIPGKVKRGSSGSLLPGYKSKIVDDAGQEVRPGEVGNLMVSSDSLPPGYWNKHEKTKETFLGTWMRTGDRYAIDEEGYFFYGGRADDVLKVSGIWVSPLEVEQALLEHEAVAECAVIGHEDEMNLIKPKAFVTLRAGFRPDRELIVALQKAVKERLAPYKYPRWIEFVDELPKTVTGKIQRYKLRQLQNKPPADFS
ncbi:MAG: benzoate-CoA ligase family protein [Deltaproteobacteria bacterium]|nr:benzoate-CoA ligase family protein [Deltaproteobacteria bacterium]